MRIPSLFKKKEATPSANVNAADNPYSSNSSDPYASSNSNLPPPAYNQGNNGSINSFRQDKSPSATEYNAGRPSGPASYGSFQSQSQGSQGRGFTAGNNGNVGAYGGEGNPPQGLQPTGDDLRAQLFGNNESRFPSRSEHQLAYDKDQRNQKESAYGFGTYLAPEGGPIPKPQPTNLNLSPEEEENRQLQSDQDTMGYYRDQSLNSMANINKTINESIAVLGSTEEMLLDQGDQLIRADANLRNTDVGAQLAKQSVNKLDGADRLFSIPYIARQIGANSKERNAAADRTQQQMAHTQTTAKYQSRNDEFRKAKKRGMYDVEDEDDDGPPKPSEQDYREEDLLYFEPTEEVRQKEIDLAVGTNQATRNAKILHHGALRINKILDQQDEIIDGLGDRADLVRTKLDATHHHLKKIYDNN